MDRLQRQPCSKSEIACNNGLMLLLCQAQQAQREHVKTCPDCQRKLRVQQQADGIEPSGPQQAGGTKQLLPVTTTEQLRDALQSADQVLLRSVLVRCVVSVMQRFEGLERKHGILKMREQLELACAASTTSEILLLLTAVSLKDCIKVIKQLKSLVQCKPAKVYQAIKGAVLAAVRGECCKESLAGISLRDLSDVDAELIARLADRLSPLQAADDAACDVLCTAVRQLLPAQCCLASHIVRLVESCQSTRQQWLELCTVVMRGAVVSANLGVLTEMLALCGQEQQPALTAAMLTLLMQFRGSIQADVCARKAAEIIQLVGTGDAPLSVELEHFATVQQQQRPNAKASKAKPCRAAVGIGQNCIQLDSQLIWVNSISGVREMVERLEDLINRDGAVLVGVDTEWGDHKECTPSVVQLACSDTAWVIDTRPDQAELEDNAAYMSEMRGGLRYIFSTPAITTIGWSFLHDIKRLRGLLGDDLEFSTIDLQPMARQHLNGAAQTPSLAHCCSALLGRALDKQEQCSDWDTRPLSQAQLQYAALDAAVLLGLQKTLGSPAESSHTNTVM